MNFGRVTRGPPDSRSGLIIGESWPCFRRLLAISCLIRSTLGDAQISSVGRAIYISSLRNIHVFRLRRPEFISWFFESSRKILVVVCRVFLEYKWVVLTVTTVGIFMATLDSSIVVVGLPQVVSDLKTNLVVGVWIITIYRLMITVLLVGIGR